MKVGKLHAGPHDVIDQCKKIILHQKISQKIALKLLNWGFKVKPRTTDLAAHPIYQLCLK